MRSAGALLLLAVVFCVAIVGIGSMIESSVEAETVDVPHSNSYRPARVANSSTTQRRAWQESVAGDSVDLHYFYVGESATSTNLRIDLDLGGGSASWVVRDPAGSVHWQGAAHQEMADAPLARTMDASAGCWLVEVRTDHAMGHYALEWTNSQ